MSGEFKAGEIVRLKSGSPAMTVEQVGATTTGEHAVWCVWFIGTKQQRETFAPAVLERVPPPTSSTGFLKRG